METLTLERLPNFPVSTNRPFNFPFADLSDGLLLFYQFPLFEGYLLTTGKVTAEGWAGS